MISIVDPVLTFELWSNSHCRTGHSSMVDEIQSQLRGVVPDLVVLSVGGGGLMNGVLEGMHRIGWTDIPLLAMETHGCHSLNDCAQAGKWTQLDEITRYRVVPLNFNYS